MARKLGAFLILAALSLPTWADDEVADDVLDQIANSAWELYLIHGPQGILGFEDRCWNDLSENNVVSAHSCTAISMSGMLIEAAMARRELRGPAPPLDPKSTRARILAKAAKAGYSEAEAQKAIEVVAAKVPRLAVALVGAGVP